MLKVDLNLCFYCGTCACVCPQEAIELLDIGEVEIDDRCVEHVCKKWSCRLCMKACPVGAIYGL
jgi:formate hydrogenlyase subunit 6/NADH:ubiquinone oxidoreductase subunit I